jgi:hypothetical protein
MYRPENFGPADTRLDLDPRRPEHNSQGTDVRSTALGRSSFSAKVCCLSPSLPRPGSVRLVQRLVVAEMAPLTQYSEVVRIVVAPVVVEARDGQDDLRALRCQRVVRDAAPLAPMRCPLPDCC